MSRYAAIDNIAAGQGWNSATLISVLLDFVDDRGMMGNLVAELLSVAEDENSDEEDSERRERVDRQCSLLSRESCLRLLDDVGIDTGEEDAIEELREAVCVNVMDDTIQESDLLSEMGDV